MLSKIIKDPEHTIQTQSDFLEYFNKKDELTKKLQEVKEEYRRLSKIYLFDLAKEYNKLCNIIDQFDGVEVFNDKIIQHEMGL